MISISAGNLVWVYHKSLCEKRKERLEIEFQPLIFVSWFVVIPYNPVIFPNLSQLKLAIGLRSQEVAIELRSKTVSRMLRIIRIRDTIILR